MLRTRERDVLMPIGNAGPAAVDQTSDLYLVVGAAVQNDVRKTKVAVGEDEVLIGRHGREQLLEEIDCRAACADFVEVILAHEASGDALARDIDLRCDTLVERTIDDAGAMQAC